MVSNRVVDYPEIASGPKAIAKRGKGDVSRFSITRIRREAADGEPSRARTTRRTVTAILALVSVPIIPMAILGVWVYFAFAQGGCLPSFRSSSAERADVGEVPSDDYMTGYLLNHRSEFTQLLDGYDETDLKELGILSPVMGDDLFITWHDGWFGGTHDKGYLYSTQALPREEHRDDGSVAYRYLPIEGDWYIYEYLDP